MAESEPIYTTELNDEGIEIKRYEFDVHDRHAGKRLDAYMAARFPEYSRTFISALIRDGAVLVDGQAVKPSWCPKGGEHILARVPTRSHEELPAQDIPLDILYEDDSIVVVNKPPDLVVHPSKGHTTGTLVNALVYHFNELSDNFGSLRPGVVHRLDRDTSGAILVIKDNAVHEEIARQFEFREVEKEYVCIVEGRVQLDGDMIDAPIGHDPRDRQKMMVRRDDGKAARTVYKVVDRVGRFSVVRCFPRSGRTHQIRVHMQYIGHPIVCDALYGLRETIYLSDLTGDEHHPGQEPLLARQALHARRITIQHPDLGRRMTFEAPIAADMMRLVEALKELRER